MKTILFMTTAFILSCIEIKAQTVKDTTITVLGNCEMCKRTIEKAVKSVDGVQYVSWDKKKKKLNVQFDTIKTSLPIIELSIISVGYDTENMMAKDSVYQTLNPCCRYDRKNNQ